MYVVANSCPPLHLLDSPLGPLACFLDDGGQKQDLENSGAREGDSLLPPLFPMWNSRKAQQEATGSRQQS